MTLRAATLYTRDMTTTENPNAMLAPYEHSYHAYPEASTLAPIIASMQERGYVGAPVLVMDGMAITGSHRIAAARELGINVTTLDLSDLTDETSLDIAARVSESLGYDLDTLDLGRVAFALHLTAEQVADYGLELGDVESALCDIRGW